MSSTLQGTTARIARYLESDLVYHQTEYIVLIWNSLDLPLDALTAQLKQLVEDVSQRTDAWFGDLSDVDWDSLTHRYIDIFSR